MQDSQTTELEYNTTLVKAQKRTSLFELARVTEEDSRRSVGGGFAMDKPATTACGAVHRQLNQSKPVT